MITLTPAYGRDYKSRAAAVADLNADKDFVLNDWESPDNGRYVNKSQLQSEGVTSVNLRFSGLRKVYPVKLS